MAYSTKLYSCQLEDLLEISKKGTYTMRHDDTRRFDILGIEPASEDSPVYCSKFDVLARGRHVLVSEMVRLCILVPK